MAARKQKFVPFLMVHYQPAVICQSQLGFDSLVLMSLLLVLECIGKSNIAAAKPEIHILNIKYKIYIYKYSELS